MEKLEQAAAEGPEAEPKKVNPILMDRENVATEIGGSEREDPTPTKSQTSDRSESEKRIRQPPGAMWYIPGETTTSAPRSQPKPEDSEDSEEEEEEAEALDMQQEAEMIEDAWRSLEGNRQLARAMADTTFSTSWESLWAEAPHSSLRADAWEELETLDNMEAPEELPIEALREQIVEHVRTHRTTILVGATGCGKSTRLPQYIMDEPKASVLVTQPRRVAAVEIAKRVASERGERVGRNVGYRISGETLVGSGKLQFATIGACRGLEILFAEGFQRQKIMSNIHENSSHLIWFWQL